MEPVRVSRCKRGVVIENLSALSEQLDRRTDDIVRWFCYTLGFGVIRDEDGNRCGVKEAGGISDEHLNLILEDFIEWLVRCPRCAGLGTRLVVRRSDDSVGVRCSACKKLSRVEEGRDRYLVGRMCDAIRRRVKYGYK